MEKYLLDIVLIAIAGFFIWGAFWVNLPAGNYGWVVYDIAQVFLLIILRQIIKQISI